MGRKGAAQTAERKKDKDKEFAAFVERQLEHRRQRAEELYERATATKAQVEGLDEDIAKAKEEGYPEAYIKRLEARKRERESENVIAVEDFKRLQAQIRDDEDFLRELRGGENDADAQGDRAEKEVS